MLQQIQISLSFLSIPFMTINFWKRYKTQFAEKRGYVNEPLRHTTLMKIIRKKRKGIKYRIKYEIEK